MSLPITITFANPPEGTCPSTFADAVTILQSLVSAQSPTGYLPYILGSSTPAVEDQNKAWIRQDAAGRPIGTFVYYAGAWRREYTGKPKEVVYFTGDPATYFDGTGRGLTTAEWDGWALCNGANGTPNMTDKFLIPAHMDNSDGTDAYSSGWRTKVSGSALFTGGSATETLTEAKTWRQVEDALVLDLFAADGDTRSSSGAMVGIHNIGTTIDGTVTLIAADAGNTTPDPFFTLPPFLAVAPCMFVGYA